MVNGMPKDFIFKNQYVDILFPIRTNITVINGDSGSGKTYMFRYLQLAKKNAELGLDMYCNFDWGKVQIVLNEESLNLIYGLEHSIIFIDRFDILENEKLLSFIANSPNIFVLCARKILGLKGFKKISSYSLVTNRNGDVLNFRLF